MKRRHCLKCGRIFNVPDIEASKPVKCPRPTCGATVPPEGNVQGKRLAQKVKKAKKAKREKTRGNDVLVVKPRDFSGVKTALIVVCCLTVLACILHFILKGKETGFSSLSAPVVSGTSPTTNWAPTWNWTSGSDGGSGKYRHKFGSSNWSSETTSTNYTPASNLSDGSYTLEVQEKDAAGEWSESGSKAIEVDTSGILITLPIEGMVGKVVPGFKVTEKNVVKERVLILVPVTERAYRIMSPLEKKFATEQTGDGRRIMSIFPGTGSGFLISDDGYLLTNKHVVQVVAEAKKNPSILRTFEELSSKDKSLLEYEHVEAVFWVFFDGKPYEAELVHESNTFDMAILKVKGVSGRPFFKLSSSIDLKQTRGIFVLGYPGEGSIPPTQIERIYELARTKSLTIAKKISEAFGPIDLKLKTNKGIVNMVAELEEYGKIVQYDVKTHRGNSGGPAVTSDGIVWGMHTLSFSEQQVSAAGLLFPMRSEIEAALKVNKSKVIWVDSPKKN